MRLRRGSLSGLCFGHALLELIDAAGGIDELLLTGIEGMTDVADPDQDGGSCGAGLDHVAASATDLCVHVFRMNVRFHRFKGPIKYQQCRR
jgi:hypothetical protein